MGWIFHAALPIWLPIRCPLKKKLCKSSKYAWNGDSGRLGSRAAIFVEKNSSLTSQLSLNYCPVSLSYLQEVSRWVIFRDFFAAEVLCCCMECDVFTSDLNNFIRNLPIYSLVYKLMNAKYLLFDAL